MQNPEWRSKIKKDPGIPNLFPYKDKILAEIEEKKRLKAEELEQKREEAKAARSEAKAKETKDLPETVMADEEELLDDQYDMEPMDEDQDVGESSNPMAALLASARARATEYDQQPEAFEDEDE